MQENVILLFEINLFDLFTLKYVFEFRFKLLKSFKVVQLPISFSLIALYCFLFCRSFRLDVRHLGECTPFPLLSVPKCPCHYFIDEPEYCVKTSGDPKYCFVVVMSPVGPKCFIHCNLHYNLRDEQRLI